MGKLKKPREKSEDDVFSALKSVAGEHVFSFSGDTGIDTGSLDSPVVARRKAEILEAALRVFSKKGFDGSRTKEIAVEAGISEATVFKYFPTKKQLLLNLMKPIVETVARPVFLSSVSKIIADSEGLGLEETMARVMIDRYEIFTKNEKLVRTLLLEMGRQPDLSGVFQQLVLPMVLGIVEPVIEKAKASGEVGKDADTRLLARSFMSMLVGTIAFVRMFPEEFARGDIKDDLRDAIRVFVNGIKGDAK